MSSKLNTLPRDFYLPSALEVAPELLGKTLVHRTPRGIISGIIIETEAYTVDDPACHAWRGMTPRNAVMFGSPGHAYVYKVHMQNCINAVCREEGIAEAVLIRALYPLDGRDLMTANRGSEDLKALCSGPGKLCQALDIDRSLNGVDIVNGPVYILNDSKRIGEIIQTTRIGISAATENLWRFYLKDFEKWVSRKAVNARCL